MGDTRITARFIDGETAEFTTRLYMCFGDRVAFERKYGVSSGTIAAHAAKMKGQVETNADGEEELREDADPEVMGGLKDEWLAYFGWRCIVRDVPNQASIGFEDFLENLEELDMVDVDAEADAPLTSDPDKLAERADADPTGVPAMTGAPSA